MYHKETKYVASIAELLLKLGFSKQDASLLLRCIIFSNPKIKSAIEEDLPDLKK